MALPPDHPDRRQKRYEVDLHVTVDSKHNFFAGAATNLSASGIFVATHIVQPIGTRVDFTIHLAGRMVKGVGEVRWMRPADYDSGQPAGMGILFVDISPEDDAAVKAFLESRVPMVYNEQAKP